MFETQANPYLTLSQNPRCNSGCKACHYKELDYPTQLVRKQEWAQTQLQRWLSVLQYIRPAPESERIGYRSKSWLRSHFNNEAAHPTLSFGKYYSRKSTQIRGRWVEEFISFDTCPLHSSQIQQIIENIKEALLAIPSFVENSLVGVWFGEPHLVLVVKDSPRISTQNLGYYQSLINIKWKDILHSPFHQVWLHKNPQVGKHVFGHSAIEPVFGCISADILREPYNLHSNAPVRAFRQVAHTLLVEARTMAIEFLLRSKPSLVVDLYCGTGDLSLLLPEEVNWIGIERSRDAVLYSNSLKPSSRVVHMAWTGAVEQRLCDPQVVSAITGSYVLFLNPPRSGLSKEAQERVLALIQKNRPLSIVYLSCSASRLARDLKEFVSAGFQVELLQPYDFFPQTEHFETLAILSSR